MTTPNESNERQTPKMKWLLGEWSWEKWISFVIGVLCVIDSGITTLSGDQPSFVQFLRALIRDGAFHTALLFFLLFYCSEMRYRFSKDVRIG